MRFLRPDQVATRLNVSKRTIYRLCEDGSLSSLDVRKCLRIPEEGLNRYIRKGIESKAVQAGFFDKP